MRLEVQVKADVERIDSAIKNVKESKEIGEIPGAERFVALLWKSHEYEAKLLSELDPFSEHFVTEYAKHKYFKGEIVKIVNYMEHAPNVLASLEKDKLSLYKELKLINDEKARLEKNAYWYYIWYI